MSRLRSSWYPKRQEDNVDEPAEGTRWHKLCEAAVTGASVVKDKQSVKKLLNQAAKLRSKDDDTKVIKKAKAWLISFNIPCIILY